MKGVGMRAAGRELGTLFNEGVVGLLSDGQLLDRFLERREASTFETITERYGPLVWGVCRRVLRDHHDAEDAFQATFLVLARKAASVLPREKLGNWLYGVAFQTAMKARATRAKRRTRESPAGEMTEPEAVLDERRTNCSCGWIGRWPACPRNIACPSSFASWRGNPTGKRPSSLAGQSALSRVGCHGPGRCSRAVCLGPTRRSRLGRWESCWLMMWRGPACRPGWSAARLKQRA